MMKEEETNCESCNHPVTTNGNASSQKVKDLCEVCKPWVESSLKRTLGVSKDVMIRPGKNMTLFDEIRMGLTELRKNKSNGAWWGPESIGVQFCTPEYVDYNGFIDSGPRNDQAWADLLEWILGTEHEAIQKIHEHLWIRENTAVESIEEIETTLARLRAKALELSEKAEYMYHDTTEPTLEITPRLASIWFGRHEVSVGCWYDQDRIWVDGVQFGDPTSLNPHCRSITILGNIIFDGAHGLDQRSIEERAFQYTRGDWLEFLRRSDSAFTPDALVIRECLHDLCAGLLGRESRNRLKACMLLWTLRPEWEFAVCDGKSWGRSFTFVREVIDSLHNRAWVTENGICIIGESGNEYSICPPDFISNYLVYRTPLPFNSHEGFNVRLTSISDDGPHICIHTTDSSRELPMGDILVSLILMLHDDINSAEVVTTLLPHLPPT